MTGGGESLLQTLRARNPVRYLYLAHTTLKNVCPQVAVFEAASES